MEWRSGVNGEQESETPAAGVNSSKVAAARLMFSQQPFAL
ncbi:MAG: hypothetical protein KatS3mg032_2204 [Cyclobacteriaceae bacterium]|nr:MAG: hypothetical protein KatS3mg032_2204 [Cyclobacteriaceae bacterium]